MIFLKNLNSNDRAQNIERKKIVFYQDWFISKYLFNKIQGSKHFIERFLDVCEFKLIKFNIEMRIYDIIL